MQLECHTTRCALSNSFLFPSFHLFHTCLLLLFPPISIWKISKDRYSGSITASKGREMRKTGLRESEKKEKNNISTIVLIPHVLKHEILYSNGIKVACMHVASKIKNDNYLGEFSEGIESTPYLHRLILSSAIAPIFNSISHSVFRFFYQNVGN